MLFRTLKSIKRNATQTLARLRGSLLKAECRLKYGPRVSIGKNLRIFGSGVLVKTAFCGASSIQIGDNCVLVNTTKYNAVGVVKPCSIVARNGVIKIGDNVGMSGVSIFSDVSIAIEDYATIGANGFIFDTDFHSTNPAERIRDHDRLVAEDVACAPIRIGRNAFIGLNAIILKGSTIGEGAIVGAGVVGSIKCDPYQRVVSGANRILPAA